MKIISWNICCLPKKLNLYHNPNKNITKIIDTIFRLNPTIILLQEVFDLKLQDTIVRNLEENSYYCHVSENLPIISSNGLLTASKEPILNRDLYKFKNNTSVEFFIEKGIQKTKIDDVTIYNTHIQSNSMIGMYSRCRHYRYGQYKETIDFIDSSEPLVFGGDLNEDYNNKNLKHLINSLSLSSYSDKLITFPKYNIQLDYILTNIDYLNSYNVIKTELSDHYIIELTNK